VRVFGQSFSSSLSGAFERSLESRKFLSKVFQVMPGSKNAFLAAGRRRPPLCVHLLFIVMPKPDIAGQKHFSEFDTPVLTWSSPKSRLPAA